MRSAGVQHDDAQPPAVVEIGCEGLNGATGFRWPWQPVGEAAKCCITVVGEQHASAAAGDKEHIEVAIIVSIDKLAIDSLPDGFQRRDLEGLPNVSLNLANE